MTFAKPENSLMQTPESTLHIRFQDCDPMGHLNNVRYFDYFLNTREEHTRKYYSLSLMKAAQEYQASWVVAEHQIAYLRPAMHDEEVIVQTKLVNVEATGLVVEAIMFDAERKHLKAVLWSSMRYVSLKTGRPTEHPGPLMPMLQELWVKEANYSPNGFHERLRVLKQELKK